MFRSILEFTMQHKIALNYYMHFTRTFREQRLKFIDFTSDCSCLSVFLALISCIPENNI